MLVCCYQLFSQCLEVRFCQVTDCDQQVHIHYPIHGILITEILFSVCPSQFSVGLAQFHCFVYVMDMYEDMNCVSVIEPLAAKCQ